MTKLAEQCHAAGLRICMTDLQSTVTGIELGFPPVRTRSMALIRQIRHSAATRWECFFREGQVWRQKNTSASGRLQMNSAVRNLCHGSTAGIDQFQNCIPAAGKVRSGLYGTGTDHAPNNAAEGMVQRNSTTPTVAPEAAIVTHRRMAGGAAGGQTMQRTTPRRDGPKEYNEDDDCAGRSDCDAPPARLAEPLGDLSLIHI